MTKQKLRDELIESKAIVDYDSEDPFVGIYFNNLYDIVCDDKILYESLLEKSIQQFSDIAELCSKLTSGNVSHLGTTIRGKAIRSAEFIDKHKNDLL